MMKMPSKTYNWERHYSQEYGRHYGAEFKQAFNDRLAGVELDSKTSLCYQDGWYRADGDITQVEMGLFA